MSIDLDHLARLAGLELDPVEIDELRRRLDALQSLIDALPSPGDEAAPGGPAPPVPLRADRPAAPLPVDRALRAAPSRRGDWLDCPPVARDDR